MGGWGVGRHNQLNSKRVNDAVCDAACVIIHVSFVIFHVSFVIIHVSCVNQSRHAPITQYTSAHSPSAVSVTVNIRGALGADKDAKTPK